MTTLPVEPRAEHASARVTKKSGGARTPAVADEAVLATLVDVHTGERVPLDAVYPDTARFDALLRDRVSDTEAPIDPHLYDLLRALVKRHESARVELVSGFRSPERNEKMRKKGHHVASHSQHSLGHAVDFRIVPAGETDEPISPRDLEQEIRALGWTGGVGVYLSASDRFVHADVGPNRRWNGL